MKEQIQVSVIVVTYNPDEKALQVTLDSIIRQKNVEFEVIITDDGSEKKDFSWIPGYFKAHAIERYKIFEHSKNVGTVRNFLAGIQAAEGKYIFGTSPGDLLFDELVLADFYNYAIDKNAKILFGNAIHYAVAASVPYVTKNYSIPLNPDIYSSNDDRGKCSFFFGNWIIGASYFRERECAQKYISQISEVCKYAEDSPSTAFALAAGEKVYYFDRNIVWYEDGTGISTGGSEKWKIILMQEYAKAFQLLRTMFPKDPLVDIAYIKYTSSNKQEEILRKLIKHPLVILKKKIFIRLKQKKMKVTSEDLLELQSMLMGD